MNVFLPNVHVPFSAAQWDTSGILSFKIALLVFKINSRMPPPDGGRDFLDLIEILTSVKMPKKNGNF